MSADHEVNSEERASQDLESELPEDRPRWWIRNPVSGVLSALVLGICTFTITLSIKTPDGTPGSTLLYLVILPIALLLPAIAIGGALIAWHGFRASHDTRRTALAAPAVLAVVLNITAAGLFARWVVQIFNH